MSRLVEPHGGVLVDRLVESSDAASFGARARSLPRIVLDAWELADLELIATGAFSPLTGFLGAADYRGVLERMRLTDGTIWPLPVTLAVTEETRAEVEDDREAALCDGAGRVWGTIEIADVFSRDLLEEATRFYGTVDPSHPGVNHLLSRPRWLIGGPVRVLPLPKDLPFASRRLTPRELRHEITARGWTRVAGFQTRNPIHRAHEHLTKLALEFTDGLVIHPLIGETQKGDVTAAVRFEAYDALVENYYPKDRTLLAAFPAAMRYAGPREAIFHALARKNYGISHFIVGRDHAGAGGFYAPYEAQEIFARFDPAELGVTPLKLDATFYCKTCETTASVRTCPHDASHRLELSGTRVRELLTSGAELPREFTRPVIAGILRAHYGTNGNGNGHGNGAGNGNGNGDGKKLAVAARISAGDESLSERPRGFILWFTGLSGAGKSTLAVALRDRLRTELPVEILDGDEVRTYLSKDLGFSKEDRDTNVRRIGYVARLLARNGVAAIAAAISPYSDARDEVRRAAEENGVPFLEIFAQADLEALLRRDVKGLYKKAVAGEIAHFTGISDPYEPPTNPEVVVRTDRESVEESLATILAALRARKLLGAVPERAATSTRPAPVFPIFLRLAGRRVVVVGGGNVAASKLEALIRSGADITVVAPEIRPGMARAGVTLVERGFEPTDLDGAWLVVAAGTPEVNRRVAAAAEERRLFVNAVDDPASASAYLGGVFRRADLTVAISTEGEAPALAGLMREALEDLIPEEIQSWFEEAARQKAVWRSTGIPMPARRPLLLAALNRLYAAKEGVPSGEGIAGVEAAR
jgi:sulfate adenylyltransferase